MRLPYSLAWIALLPFAFLYLLWRARRQPDYLRHWGERLGLSPVTPKDRPAIWLHAVSVGETRAAAPLIQAIRARHPGHAILLSHGTPTGRATGRELFGDSVVQFYLPYDFPPLVRLFLLRSRPALGVIMETEIWPNLYAACRRRDIPLFLVNARLSEKSARGYRRFRMLLAPALRGLTGIAAQTRSDSQRLIQLGAETVTVTGNLKFDVTPPGNTEVATRELRAAFANRFVFLGASTREGEEAMILDALAGLDIPDLLIVLVPRHPQRFESVAALLDARQLAHGRRGSKQAMPAGCRVFLGDSMGEMAAYYAAADLAYVGGSLLPFGGQNLIEAAAMGCPALIGPHTWNFDEAAEQAVACGAARRVADVEELSRNVESLRRQPDALRSMRAAGLRFAEANRGTTERVMGLLEAGLARPR
jgi:3-deoxy-D-manno-octulosonic-acid transferase